MKSSGSPKQRTPRGQFAKLPRAAYIWGGITAAFIILLAVMFFVGNSGGNSSYPLLLIYNRADKEIYVQRTAFTNTLHAASFEYEFLSTDANEIPESISGRDVVVMGIGKDSFALMRDIAEDELKTANRGGNNILGFILVDPAYPGNMSVEKYDSSFPKCEVAFFGFGKTASETSGMSDIRRLFERMSGVDTVYGAYATRGSLASSRIYSSADQKRYLSLYNDQSYETLINSPIFQSELAGYLAGTYGTKLSYGRINSWFVLESMGIVFGIASLFMFLFFIPVPERKGISFDKIGDDGMAAIVNMGLAIWFGVVIVAGLMIPFTAHYVKYVLLLCPTFMMLVMFVMRLGFMLTNKVKYSRRKQGLIRTAAAGAAALMLFIFIWLPFSSGYHDHSAKRIVITICIFIIDFFVTTCLGFIDKKSRAAGENGCSYFGNIFYPIEMLIPAGTALVVSFLGMGTLLMAIRGLLIVIVPFVLSYPVKRISDNVMVAGLVHAVSAALLIL
ncbi:MAG: hypothetical protein IKE53_03640 [Clostridiales bacterium]|nr:hypothetical protein [Clostridiales bacterium]